MKTKASWIVTVLFLSFFTYDLEARGGGGGGGGASRGGARAGGGASRSPMTGSKMSRPTTKPSYSKPSYSKPTTRPATKPATRPATKPATRPATKPATRPSTKPSTKPATKPSTKPAERPSTLPGNTRPGTGGSGNRPSTLPGNTRPGTGTGTGLNRPSTLPGNTRPGTGNGTGMNRPTTKPMPLPGRPETKPGHVGYPRPGTGGNNNIGNRPGFGNNNTVNRPGGGNTVINNRPVNINRPNINNRPSTKPAWDNNQWGNWGNWNNNRPGYGNNRPGFGNNVNIGNNVNVNINNNFHNNHNWGYKPNYWGSRPWWNANNCHGWHHGSWNYGWNSGWYGRYNYYRPRPWPGYYYNDNDFAKGVAWGIAAWGLGNMIYNIGYQSYSNPYPAPPVQSSAGTTIINYSEPITVSAGNLPPGDAAAQTSAEEKSSVALEASRASFKRGDYLAAMKSVDEAIAWVPGDPAIHEYRALVLFALGKYGDAAGVLNPVLASGPGWDWTTMTGLYGSQTTYTDQLRKLEDYARAMPTDAATRFLLGYHYLVCAHLDQAYEQFDQAARLQPADTIAAQLRDLCKSSISPDKGDAPTPPVEAEKAPAPPPVPADKLVGTWVSDRGEQGKVTLNLAADGKFTWTFSKAGENKPADLSGDFSIDERGLLVLASEDSQMVGEIKLPEDTKLNFILAGGPQGDPGLSFDKAP
jgi:tetratricopeptide (TPR) repeat protein